jgi:DNA-directed RNA polymerase specialized sigma24 family protein
VREQHGTAQVEGAVADVEQVRVGVEVVVGEVHLEVRRDVREDGVDPSSSAGDRELAREILRGIESLPLPQREIFLLVRYHGFTFADAAAATGVSLSAAKMSVTRAHEKLLRLLGGRLHLESLL